MSQWTEVVHRKGHVKFPAMCPRCLEPKVSASIRISDRRDRVKCDVPYCSRCAGRIGWSPFLFSAVLVGELSEEWILFRFRSTEYAHQFLETNPTGFTPELGWRWKSKVKKGLTHLVRFAAIYSLYLGIVLPFAHARIAEIVPWLGIPFGIAAVYVWAQLLSPKTKNGPNPHQKS